MMNKLLTFFIILIISCMFASAEITFFESDLGQNDNFIMAESANSSARSQEINQTRDSSGSDFAFSPKTAITDEAGCEAILLYSEKNHMSSDLKFNESQKKEIMEILSANYSEVSLQYVDRLISDYNNLCKYNIRVSFANYVKKSIVLPVLFLILIIILLVIIIYKNRKPKKKR